ncbi:hypothetical protein [Schaalia vaccimaxillae]|uniref:hypothetical protein n=1 Tax=Schaalia vaccimaxillae TaxID=183916 RepID=UPI0003B4FF72|nr:hypothetical protein [Schaalia vaccimaxillae]
MSDASPNGPWREVRRWMRAAPPVNKGTAPQAPRLPQISSPLLIGALGLSAIGAGVALRAMRPARRGGRADRFTELVVEVVEQGVAEDTPARQVRVEVGEGFGKPSLVTVDVIVAPSDEANDADKARDLLDLVSRAVWNNSEIAPVAVRARVLLAQNQNGPALEDEAREVADMTVLGFDDEIARPADLYARFGAPASDRSWRP